MLKINFTKKIVYAGLILNMMVVSSALAMIMEISPIGKDLLNVKGKFSNSNAVILDQQRLFSVRPKHFWFESLSKTKLKNGRQVLVHVIGSGKKGSAISTGLITFYDPKNNNTLERATYVHTEDHPHTTTIASKSGRKS